MKSMALQGRPLLSGVGYSLGSVLLAASILLTGCTNPEMTADAGAASDGQVAIVTSPNDSRAYRPLTLPNNLEVLLVHDPAVEKSAAALSVGVGLMFDPMSHQGMAHYLEHMLFLGNEKYPEPDEFMAFTNQNGGSTNAYTWLDITNYMFQIKNDTYEEGLDRFSNFFKTPLLDPEYIEKEKNAVNAEWSMRREMDVFGVFRLGRSLMGEHPANRFLIGNLESLSDKPDSKLHTSTVDFYKQYYSANIMKVAMVSHLSLDDMQALAKAYFADIPNTNIAKPEVNAPIDFSQAGNKFIRYVPQEEKRSLQLQFIIESNADKFRVKPNQYLAYIIGSEMPNTPASRLKELGWAESLMVSASPDEFGNFGSFTIDVALTDAGMEHRAEMTDLLLGYIDRLRKDGVDDRYAAEFKTSLDNKFRFLEKVNDFSYVSQLAAAMQDYPLESVIDAPFRFDGFDADAVNEVLSQLVPERLQVWYISKDEPAIEEQKFYAGKYAVEALKLGSPEQQMALVDQYHLAQPALNTLLPESFEVAHADSTPVMAIDQEGIELWLQGSEYFSEQPKGFTKLYLNSPSRDESAEVAVHLAIWSDLYNQAQTTLFTEASVAGMNAGLSPSFGVELTFSGFTDKQPELIRAALAALRINPTETEIAQAVDRYTRAISNSKRAFPFRQLFPTLRLITRTGNYSDEALLAAAEGVSQESLQQFVEQELARVLVRGYMFGNYSQKDAAGIAELLRAALPNRSPTGYARPRILNPILGETLVFQADLPVEDLGMLYVFAAPEASVVNKARGQVLAEYLSNRTFNTLRTEEQLGYAAGGLAGEIGEHPVLGLYIQTPVKNPVDMLARFDTYLGEFGEDLATLSQEDFERFKQGVLTTLNEPPKNLAAEAGPFIADWERERYDFDSKQQLIAAVEQVSVEDIRDYYQETVMSEKPSRILVQLKGRAYADQPFAEIEGASVITDIAAFHEAMPIQPQR